MKTITITALLIFFFVWQTAAQDYKWEVVGSADGWVFGIETTTITHRHADIEFTAARVKKDGDKLDPNNKVLAHFFANCNSHIYMIAEEKGTLDGKPYDQKFEPKLELAEKGHIDYDLIEEGCHIALGLKV